MVARYDKYSLLHPLSTPLVQIQKKMYLKIKTIFFYLVCGIQTNRRQKYGIDGLSKMASHGDWPWHAILYKSGTHVCDGTLISSEWLLTSASCFQG